MLSKVELPVLDTRSTCLDTKDFDVIHKIRKNITHVFIDIRQGKGKNSK